MDANKNTVTKLRNQFTLDRLYETFDTDNRLQELTAVQRSD